MSTKTLTHILNVHFYLHSHHFRTLLHTLQEKTLFYGTRNERKYMSVLFSILCRFMCEIYNEKKRIYTQQRR